MLKIKRNHVPQQNLERLLKNVDRSLYNTVLFENFRHYVLKSHELVDEGLIDRVIFTDKCSKENLKDFAGSKKNYICGSIAHQCIKAAKKYIREYAPFFSVIPIRDCISYYQPSFKHKIKAHLLLPFYWSTMSKEDINDISFHIPSKIYSLVRGGK